MAFANSIILYNAKINHNGLFACDFGGSGATRDAVMGGSSNIATYKFGYSNMTYMRKDKVIVVDENADVLDNAGVNYCRFINGDFDASRYIYAFVDDIEYVAPQTSRLHIRTDCWMTWFDRIIPNQCFVEREHVAVDTPFINSLPENIGTGELIRYQTQRLLGDNISNDEDNWIAAFNVIGDPDEMQLGSYLGVVSVGGIISGTYWYGVALDDVMLFTKYLTENSGTILSVSLIPKISSWINDGEDITISGVNVHVYHLRDITSAEWGYDGSITINAGDGSAGWSGSAGTVNDITINLNNYINSFKDTFNNCKLLCYPYTAWEIFTYDGSSTTLLPQDNTARLMGGTFAVKGVDTIVGGATPSETFVVGIDTGSSTEIAPFATQSFSGFPTIAVTVDAYAQFVARNANSLKFQKDVAVRDGTFKLINSTADMVKNGVDGDLMGGLNSFKNIISAGDQIDSIDAKMSDMKAAPDSVAGHASDGSLFMLNRLGIFFAIKRQNSSILYAADSYFDRYGYAVKETKTPQWNSRSKFNYIKTGGANIGGQIPKSDKDTINQLLDTGMTVWHNAADYGTFDGRANRAGTR